MPLKTRKTLNYRLMLTNTKATENKAESGNLVNPVLADGFLLIPMLDFVKYIGNRDEFVSNERDIAEIYNYAIFLSKPLKEEMFFPCDEKGILLEKPEQYDEWLKSDYYFNASESVTRNCSEYRKALNRVLFKNTSACLDDGVYWLILNNNYIAFYDFKDKFSDQILEDFAFRKDLILKDNHFESIR